jgi:hypothetical protein
MFLILISLYINIIKIQVAYIPYKLHWSTFGIQIVFIFFSGSNFGSKSDHVFIRDQISFHIIKEFS